MLPYIIGLVIGFAVPLLLTYLALRSVVSDAWSLLLLSELPSRRIAGIIISLLWLVPIVWGSMALLGITRPGAILFISFATAPALSWVSLRWWAWWRDDLDTRLAAFQVATERANRRSEPPPLVDQKMPWKDYVFDVEVARRRELYEPPPI